MTDVIVSEIDGLVDRTESRRIFESAAREPALREQLGQFFTPAPLASLLSKAFEPREGTIRVLDAGAGVGSLTVALLNRISEEGWNLDLSLTAVETDCELIPSLSQTLLECDRQENVSTRIIQDDFIEWACSQLDPGLFAETQETFDFAILNPPYKKLNTDTAERRKLSALGIEVTNLYAAFVALSLRLLAPGGQLVAITPRSFCNGPYFRAFRKELLGTAALKRIHVFESRTAAFMDTAVLQENVIFHLIKGEMQGPVVIASSTGESDSPITERTVAFESVVKADDREAFIHIVSENEGRGVAGRVANLPSTFAATGLSVSTGRVVDFRFREHLRMNPNSESVPLLYPMHLRGGRVRWPIADSKKANALANNENTASMLLPAGNYVLVKRFSTKEERRRISATVLLRSDLDAELVAIENHVNVFHIRNGGMGDDLAWGLATFLNSTVIDTYFRQFNGHTQVNATDLRSLRYPSCETLVAIGSTAKNLELEQCSVDLVISAHLGWDQ